MSVLVRYVCNGVENLQPWHDFAGSERLYLKVVVGRLGNVLGDCFATAVKGVEGLWPACRQAPFHRWTRLCDGGRSDHGCARPGAGGLQKFTSFHGYVPPHSCTSAANLK